MSFYITLPSSTSALGSTSDFTTILAQPIQLNQKYKVALVELVYNHSWKIDLGNLYLFNTNNNGFVEQIEKIPLFLDDSFTINSLIEKINLQIKNYIIRILYDKRYNEMLEKITNKEPLENNKLYPKFKYDSSIKNTELIEEFKKSLEYLNAPTLKFEQNKLSVNLNSKLISQIALQGRVLEEIGYSESIVMLMKTGAEIITLDKVIDPSKKLKIQGPIYIYAPDLIEFQYVGNTKAPLLRTAVVEPTQEEKTIWINFDRPHYVNVHNNTISKIKIHIKDEYDDNIGFDYSSITLKLHFVPAQNLV